MTNYNPVPRDLSLLAINLLTYRIFTRLPMTLIKSADTSAFLTVFLCGSVFVIALIILCKFVFKYSSGNILDTAEKVFGIWGRVIVSAVFAIYLVVSQTFALSEFAELIKLIAFPTSPIWFVSGFLILGGIWGALGNNQSVIRLHGVFMPIILSIIALLILSTIFPNNSSDTIVPIFDSNTFSIKLITSQFMLYGDIALLFLLLPIGKDNRNVTKNFVCGSIFAVLLNTLFILAFVLKIPSAIAQNGQFPIYLLMKEVYFGRFFQRLDALILLACAVSSMLYIALSLNLLTDVLHQGFKIRQKRIIPLIFGTLSFLLVLNKWILSGKSLLSLVYIFSFSVLAILVITAVFVWIRRASYEKN